MSNTNIDGSLDAIAPEISLKLANSVQIRVTGGAEDDLEDVRDAADDQLIAALDGVEHVRDLKQSLNGDGEDRNGHGVR